MIWFMCWMWLVGVLALHNNATSWDSEPFKIQDWLAILTWPVSIPLALVWMVIFYEQG